MRIIIWMFRRKKLKREHEQVARIEEISVWKAVHINQTALSCLLFRSKPSERLHLVRIPERSSWRPDKLFAAISKRRLQNNEFNIESRLLAIATGVQDCRE
jgi:hypothetical protein